MAYIIASNVVIDIVIMNIIGFLAISIAKATVMMVVMLVIKQHRLKFSLLALTGLCQTNLK